MRLVIDGLNKINIILVGEMEGGINPTVRSACRKRCWAMGEMEGGIDPTVQPITIEYIKLEAAIELKKHLHSQNRDIENTLPERRAPSKLSWQNV